MKVSLVDSRPQGIDVKADDSVGESPVKELQTLSVSNEESILSAVAEIPDLAQRMTRASH